MAKQNKASQPAGVLIPGKGLKLVPVSAEGELAYRPASIAKAVGRDFGLQQNKIEALFFQTADRIVEELEQMAKRRKSFKGMKFSKARSKQLRRKITSGIFNWAIAMMGKRFSRYLEEGEKSFLILFTLHFENAYRTEPIDKGDFWKWFDATAFIVPKKLPRTDTIHPAEWKRIWKNYNDVLARIRKIPLATRRTSGLYLMALKEALPGMSDRLLKKLVLENGSKPSDIAAEYVSRNLSARGQAVKEYFKVFHSRYGHYDHLVTYLNKLE
jgi:hypothetical protein